MNAAAAPEAELHGGRLVARRLRAAGVGRLFTLSGGHLFSLYDGCRAEGIELVDVRHEATAAFAAEGHAKVTREIGVCAVTAGPGVTNAMSPLASARANHSPMLMLGGRAPAMRWGQGSLQEIDHVPFVAPLTKFAATPRSTAEIPLLVERAISAATELHGGPAFVDLPLDYVFMSAPDTAAGDRPAGDAEAGDRGRVNAGAPLDSETSLDSGAAPGSGASLERAGELLRSARRPVLMAGSDLYWARAEGAMRELVEDLRIPVFLNGLARGCLPADHELFHSRVRGRALREADVALLVGAPMDFRLAFGQAFGAKTRIVAVDSAAPETSYPREPAASCVGDIPASLRALLAAAGPGPLASEEWLGALGEEERVLREGERAELADERAPLHPVRVYGELRGMLDRDAIVIGDGGDFVSYAGRLIDSHEPGCWLDPGPFGCLGSGPGYALAAKLAHPRRQVLLLLGDGAFGFAGMEFDTLARHGVDVVGVIGNNGIWGLEKRPMEFLYGYSVAADLRPGTRYDEVVAALGGHGELVERPQQLRGALERAFSAGRPALVNVLTDPAVAYPRKSNLA